MSDADSHAITTLERLREVVGETFPGLDLKNQPTLDEFAIDFLARSSNPGKVVSRCSTDPARRVIVSSSPAVRPWR